MNDVKPQVKKQYVEDVEHCEHDFEFVAEEEGVTLYGKAEWEWLFECPHCGAERAEKSPYSYWDKRNW